MNRIEAALCALLFAAAVHPAQARQQATPAPDGQAPLAEAEAIAQALFVHDRAAAVATDALQALRQFRKDKRVAGWVTEEDAGNITVTFVGPRGDAPKQALYRAVVTPGGELVGKAEVLEHPQDLTPYESSAFAARTTALASDFEPCAKTYNPVVLPAPAGAPFAWRAYLLPGTSKRGVVPLGGTYRVDVAADGHTIVDQRGFTRTCIQLGSGPDVEAMMVSHLMDPAPTEVHVFWSLWAATPLYVSTSGGLWHIADGKIRAVGLEDE